MSQKKNRRTLRALALALLIAAPGASAQPVDELFAVFEQLMRDPANPGLNLRYARLSAARGDIDRSIAAYERVLAADPGNAEARRELQQLQVATAPPTTDLVVTLGGQYESNAPRRDPSFKTLEDASAYASLSLRDERSLLGYRWRSFGTLYQSIHNRFSQGDFGYVGANTGPVLPLPNGWAFRPAVGGALAELHWQGLFTELAGLGTLDTPGFGPVEQITARVAHDDWSQRHPGRDAWVGELGATLAWRDVLTPGARLAVFPDYTFNGAEAGENRYHGVGAGFDYVVPAFTFISAEAPALLRQSSVGLELLTQARLYQGRDPTSQPGDDRRDYYVAPGIRFALPNALGQDEVWTLRYLFEDNFSNDSNSKYRNHQVGLTVSWRM
jgi:tetratricopeptide (TPR) repeat protein